MAGKDAAGPGTRRAAAVLLLAVAAAIGLRAGGAFPAAASPQLLTASGRVLYWALVTVTGVLGLAGLVILLIRAIWLRRRAADRPPHRAKTPWWVLLLPIAAVALSRLLAYLRRQHAAAGVATPRASTHPAQAGARVLPSGSAWPLLAAMAVLAVTAAALMVSARRRRAAPGPPKPARPSPLASAVVAATQALREDGDPRTAIVSCYAAMERAFTEAGSPPSAADTPAEVLARAAADGLALPTAATTLTRLFRQARYGAHRMTEADRSAALGALASLRAGLGGAG